MTDEEILIKAYPSGCISYELGEKAILNLMAKARQAQKEEDENLFNMRGMGSEAKQLEKHDELIRQAERNLHLRHIEDACPTCPYCNKLKGQVEQRIIEKVKKMWVAGWHNGEPYVIRKDVLKLLESEG